MVGFIFGEGQAAKTPEELKRMRAIIASLQAGKGAPRNVGEGLNALGDGIVANVMNRRADAAEDAGRSGFNSTFADLFSGGVGKVKSPGFSSAPVDPVTTSATSGGGMSPYREAIASIESAGDGGYAAVGPTHPKMGRALGRYQVMEANIGPWSKAALGREVTPEEFMASPELQDAIFDHRFGGYVKQYGPEGAASMWFTGRPSAPNAKDVLGTSGAQYVSKFNRALGKRGNDTLAGGPDGDRLVDPTQRVDQAFDAVAGGPQGGLTPDQALDYAKSVNPAIPQGMQPQQAPVAQMQPPASPPPVDPTQTAAVPPQQAIAQALNRGGGGLSRAMFDDAGSAGNPAVQAALARQGGQPQPSAGNPLQAIAQALMGGGQPQQAPAPASAPQAPPAPQQGGGDRLQQLVMAASNPWATDEQRALIGMEIKRLQEEQDPLRQLEIQNAQLELDQKRRGVQAKAPDVQTFYDPESGQEYKAQWNASSGQWDRIGGTKASKDGGLQVTLPDGTTVQQGSFDKQDAKNVANRVTEEQEAAAAGSTLKQTVGLLREANQNVGYSGPGAGIYGGVDNALEGVGMPSLPGNSGARAVMTSGGLEVALGQVQKTKGAISNAEMGLFMAAAPGLANTPQGNAALFDMIDAIADRQIERAAAIETYRQQHGGSLDGFEKQWSDYINANPLILKGDGGGIRLNIGPRREQGAPTADNDPLGIR